MIFKEKQRAWVDAAAALGHPAGSVVGYPEIDDICESMGGVTRPWWLINDKSFRAGRGRFTIPVEGAPSAALPPVSPVAPTVAPPAPIASPAPAGDHFEEKACNWPVNFR